MAMCRIAGSLFFFPPAEGIFSVAASFRFFRFAAIGSMDRLAMQSVGRQFFFRNDLFL